MLTLQKKDKCALLDGHKHQVGQARMHENYAINTPQTHIGCPA
jgi:hypothetical protein